MKNKIKFSNELPNFDINIFDDQQNERIGVRFVPITDSEVEFDQNGRKLYDINFVKQFLLTEHGEMRSIIEEIPAVELTNYLRKFILAVRTK